MNLEKSFLLIILVCIGFSIEAQISYGPKLGLTYSSFSKKDIGNDPVYDTESGKAGLLVGVFVRKQFPSEFHIQVQADYRTSLGGSFSSSSLSKEVSGANLYLPVTFGSTISYNISWYLGGAIGIPLDPNTEGFDQFASGNSLEFSIEEMRIDLLAGVNINLSKISIDVGYYLGSLLPYYYTYSISSGSHESQLNLNQIVVSAGFDIGKN